MVAPETFADPAALVRTVVRAKEREEWATVAACCDEASILLLRRTVLGMLEAPRTPYTAEMAMRHDPTLPRAVAEWRAARAAQFADPAARLADELPGVRTLEAARALAPHDFLARWLAGRGFAGALERAVATGHLDDARRTALLDHHRTRVAAAEPTITVGPPFDLSATFLFVPWRVSYPGMHDDGEWRSEWERERATYTAAERALGDERLVAGEVESYTLRRQPDGEWRVVVDHGTFGGTSAVISSADEPDSDPPA